MKTIRKNTFETNSSSTHALTVYYDGWKPSIRPIIENESNLVIKLGGYHSLDGSDGWFAKLEFLALYLACKERKDEIVKLGEYVTEFINHKITFDDSSDEKQDVFDTFGDFINEDYGMSEEDFEETVEKILSSKDNILGFVFSEKGTYSETYFDG